MRPAPSIEQSRYRIVINQYGQTRTYCWAESKQEAYRAAKEKAVSMGLLVKFLLAGLPPKEVL